MRPIFTRISKKSLLQVELVFLNICFKRYVGCSFKFTRKERIIFSFYNMRFEFCFIKPADNFNSEVFFSDLDPFIS